MKMMAAKKGKRDTTHMTDDRGKTSASSLETSIENIYDRLGLIATLSAPSRDRVL